METKHTYHFLINMYGKWVSTPYRESRNKAWRDAYNMLSKHDAHITAMTLVHDTAQVATEGAQ